LGHLVRARSGEAHAADGMVDQFKVEFACSALRAGV
jgi:hypothetical protein